MIVAVIVTGVLSTNNPVLGAALFISVILWFFAAIIMVLVKSQQLWTRYSDSTKTSSRLIIYSISGLILLLVAVFGTYTTTENISYSSTFVSDGNLELGQSEIKQPGRNGEKKIKHNLLFGFVIDTSQTSPVDEIKAKGIKRYQYMYCSDGGYRYFEADQFKDPNVGFTHQSADSCAQNGQGKMTTLADVPPAKIQNNVTRTYPTSTQCYSFSEYSFSCHSY